MLYQLSYSRPKLANNVERYILTDPRAANTIMVEGGGFEPPKASPTDLQSVPFGRSGTPPHIVFYYLELAMGLEPATC